MFYRFLLLSIFCLTTLFAEEETLPALEASVAEPPIEISEQKVPSVIGASQLIGGLVSPISGKLYLSKTDCVVAGANPLALKRAYLAPHMPYRFRKANDADSYYRWEYLRKNYKGWKFFPHTELTYDFFSQRVQLNTPSGASYTFSLAGGKSTLVQSYGVSNCGVGATPSGQLDMRNAMISCVNDQILVQSPDGTTYFYKQRVPKKNTDLLYRFHLPTITPKYFLEKERLSNGKYVHYLYNKDYQLIRVESLDSTEKELYASLDINRASKEKNVKYTSSRGENRSYLFEQRFVRYKFRENKKKYDSYLVAPLALREMSSGESKQESINYSRIPLLMDTFSDKTKTFRVERAGFGKGINCHYRINKLLFPVGEEDSFESVYEIDYQPAIAGILPGVTTVKNCNGTTTTYHISKELLIDRIEYPNKEERFTWSPNHWLAKATVLDKEGNLLVEKEYQYDTFGNPIVESIQDGSTIKREFSQDGRNLLLREENEDGLVTQLKYLPETNLVCEKIVGKIRETFEYDGSHNFIGKILEESPERKQIVRIQLYQSGDFIHMPEWIENKYLEDGQEKLLKRTHLIYDQYGNIAQEELYDAAGIYQYTIVREWDEAGNLLSETNALGQKESFAYDSRSHCIEEEGVVQTIKREFDLQGRVRQENTLTDDCPEKIKRFTYDVNDNLTHQVDEQGHEFAYKYDPATQQVVEATGPDWATTLATYDSLGRKESETDGNGNTTKSEYNIYGDPTRIVYPNESVEHFTYDKSGKLISQTDREGHTTEWSYDLLGRPTSKRRASCEERFVYEGLKLVQKEDREGHTTIYGYDGAGRKIMESREGKTTSFVYDTMGRLAVELVGDLATHYTYDGLDRVVEEQQKENETLLRRIAYHYDEAGNLSTVERWIDGQHTKESYQYDGLGREVLYVDGCGHKTTTHYDDDLQQKRTVDPKGVVTTETMDGYGRLVQKDVQDVQHCEKRYDANGNVVDWEQGSCVHFEYTSDNKVCRIERAFGTNKSKVTEYSYTPGGKVATKTLPDGIILNYGYDELGYLSTIDSSDGSIQHRFTHNKLGKLLFTEDLVDGTWVEREVDAFGNVLVERFSNGIEVCKSYDVHDRPLKLTIPNVGSVQYTYDPLFLREVTRFAADGEKLYSHKYTKYDLSGNPLTEEMGFGCGTVTNCYDGMGRKYRITSPYFIQSNTFDGSGNLIVKEVNQEASTYTYDLLGQIASENNTLYEHDALYNRLGNKQVNVLNEYTHLAYDGNGNQVQNRGAEYTFDPLNRLKVATINDQTIRFLYDPLGRRLSKMLDEQTVENYIYDGLHEIGAFDEQGCVKNFRVLSAIDKTRPATLAIELEGKAHLVVNDTQNNVVVLVDPHAKIQSAEYRFTSFGESFVLEEDEFNPWRYASKRFDPDLGLVNFGRRDYEASLGRWLSPDPAGFVDSLNLYQYAFNNPFQYYDPNGEFLFALTIPFTMLFAPALIAPVCAKAIFAGVVAVGAACAGKVVSDAVGWSWSPSEADCYDYVSGSFGVVGTCASQMSRSTKENREEKPAPQTEDLEKDPNWKRTSHPNLEERGSREYTNIKTGEKIRYDKGRPGETGHEANDHYHRYNPKAPRGKKGDSERYLDKDGNPIHKNNKQSHLYPPEGVTWDY